MTKLNIRRVQRHQRVIEGQTMQWPKEKTQKETNTMIYRALHRKQKIGHHESH
jgi:hypothetical protein